MLGATRTKGCFQICQVFIWDFRTFIFGYIVVHTLSTYSKMILSRMLPLICFHNRSRDRPLDSDDEVLEGVPSEFWLSTLSSSLPSASSLASPSCSASSLWTTAGCNRTTTSATAQFRAISCSRSRKLSSPRVSSGRIQDVQRGRGPKTVGFGGWRRLIRMSQAQISIDARPRRRRRGCRCRYH